MAVVRSGDYKLIEYLETKELELYNLKEDISEEDNLLEKEPTKKEQMYMLLRDWKKAYLIPSKTKIRKPKPKGQRSGKGKKKN